jgi:hypothetical protein
MIAACPMTELGLHIGRSISPSPIPAIIAAIPRHAGETKMPTKITLELLGVWFCVGFFTGAGWAIAAWLVGRILTAI